MKLSSLLATTLWIVTFSLSAASWAAENQTMSTRSNREKETLGFKMLDKGELAFDTGVLRGKLRAKGKSLGLTEVEHSATGKRVDRSNGLFSHYRVFTRNKRYGGGAWDWPSEAKVLEGGAVEVNWPVAEDRPFTMRAVYQWRSPSVLDLETVVSATSDLTGFESFLASYFSESFNSCEVNATHPSGPARESAFLPTLSSYGTWLMFPREEPVVTLIKDGRWKLLPNPVDWTIMPPFSQPLVFRRDPVTGLTFVLMSRRADCFTLAMPHQAEQHYSCYFSLFGRDFKAGEVGRARIRLAVIQNKDASATERQALSLYKDFLAETASER